MKSNISQKGFTIVELLIVIVVIGILAAIVIVAFNGVQARANLTSAKSAAATIQKKAEAYNSINSAYPTTVAAFATTEESKIDGGLSLGTPTAANGKTTVQYQTCTGGGFRVNYWNYTASPAAVSAAADAVHGGGATSSSTCTTVS